MRRRAGQGRQRTGWPSPAMAVALLALVLALTGTAWAALGKNSVGTRQLKAQAVSTGKIANNAVNGAKVADGSLTGSDINIGALGTVPEATNATNAANAATVAGHGAACPANTTLIRGLCFDSSAGPEVANVKVAADACAAKGGWLPTPLQLYSVRSVINLGTGTGTNYQFTDAYYANTSGSNYRTVVVDGTGGVTEKEVTAAGHYVCVYPLVR